MKMLNKLHGNEWAYTVKLNLKLKKTVSLEKKTIWNLFFTCFKKKLSLFNLFTFVYSFHFLNLYACTTNGVLVTVVERES